MATKKSAVNFACPVLGCTHKRKSGQVMCRHCWFHVPKAIRDRVWSFYHKARFSQAHRDAVQEAIASVPPIQQPVAK